MASEKLNREVSKALAALLRGGIILYPTDTLWGIGCDATNEGAVNRIYNLKKSKDKKSMLVLIADSKDLNKYAVEAPFVAHELVDIVEKPTTVIVPGATGVAPNLVPEEGTIGIRIPKHAFCQALLKELKKPLVSTSANLSGMPAPLVFADIDPQIVDGVDYIVDIAMEGEMTREASSIIKLGREGDVEVIRK